MKFVEAANNFTKFVGLANNFWKVHKTCKNFMKFVDWRVGFRCLKVFLYLCFTRFNISIGKRKCFVNASHVSWILFTNKSNSDHSIWVDKIFGTVKKVAVGHIRQVVILYKVNTTTYFLGGLVSGCDGEVVIL